MVALLEPVTGKPTTLESKPANPLATILVPITGSKRQNE